MKLTKSTKIVLELSEEETRVLMTWAAKSAGSHPFPAELYGKLSVNNIEPLKCSVNKLGNFNIDKQ